MKRVYKIGKTTKAVAVIIVIFIIFSFVIFLSSCRKKELDIDTFTVESGDLVQSVSASGYVDTPQHKNYSLQKAGEVLSALETGDSFKKGDVLLELDNSRSEILYKQAEENLLLAEDSIDIAKINFQAALDANHIVVQLSELNTELASQQTASALRSLEDANGLARTSADSALIAIENARRYLEALQDEPLATDAQVAQAEGSVESAESAYDTTVMTQRAQTDGAESAYEQAQTNESVTYWTNLNNLQTAQVQIRLTKESIDQVEKQLELSNISLELAGLDLDNNIIYAPFDGIVLSSIFSPGEYGSPGVNAISIMRSDYIIKSDINETDILKIEPGQSVQIELDAYPEQFFYGEVTDISPLSKNTANIITFEIEVTPDEASAEYLLYGISANITVTTSESSNILYVPIEAVYEEDLKKYVDILTSEDYDVENIEEFIEKVEVTTGNFSYDYMEITSGLEPGDIVILSRIEDILNQDEEPQSPRGGFF